MLKIEEGAIYLTKGDDAVIDVQITNISGESYKMQPGDTLALTVREKPDANSDLIMSVVSNAGESSITIIGAATEMVKPGPYSADIQLNTADGKRHTIWPELEGSARFKIENLKNFVVMPEVTSP